MTTTEQRLHDALTARTEHVAGDPRSLAALRARLSPPTRQRRRRAVPVLAAAPATVGVVVAAGAVTQQGPAGESNEVAAPALSGAPWPADRHVVAVADGANVVVEVPSGRIVATLPSPEDGHLHGAVLSPDGTRVYGSWGSDPGHVGYLDVVNGRFVSLDSRAGALTGVTVSADGGTLAYEWYDASLGARESSSSIVVRRLDGTDPVVIGKAPAGPQVLPLALSPDGSRLAVVPTNNNHESRTMLLQDVSPGARVQMVESTCPDGLGRYDSPRWTQSGLFAHERCGANDVAVPDTAFLVKIDPATGRSRALHQLAWSGITRLAVVDGSAGLRFVASDETVPADGSVRLLDPGSGWSSTLLEGVDGLAATAAQ
jgi:hypothetical protein